MRKAVPDKEMVEYLESLPTRDDWEIHWYNDDDEWEEELQAVAIHRPTGYQVGPFGFLCTKHQDHLMMVDDCYEAIAIATEQHQREIERQENLARLRELREDRRRNPRGRMASEL